MFAFIFKVYSKCTESILKRFVNLFKSQNYPDSFNSLIVSEAADPVDYDKNDGNNRFDSS